MDNQEKVWKKEEERAKEQSKLEDIRKQIADERQKEELEMIAAAAGHKVYVLLAYSSTLLSSPTFLIVSAGT